MNCHIYDEALGDYIDGTRDREFEGHLAGCARCQAVVADFARIRGAVSTLEEPIPPPRVWARVAAAIDEKPKRGFVWVPVAVAASLALLVAGATWLAWREAPPAAPQVAQQTAVPADDAAVPADAHYDDAIAGLQQLADAQDAALDPSTRDVLQKNLEVVDRAITESRAALATEPANAVAQESLLDALDTKVALLQDTVDLGTAKEFNQ
jgi:uncharacterized membrane protein